MVRHLIQLSATDEEKLLRFQEAAVLLASQRAAEYPRRCGQSPN